MQIGRLFYLSSWFLRSRFLRAERPLQTVLFVSNVCNLACKHCNIYARDQVFHKTYDQIADELRYSYKLGSRFVDYEGGEPFLWRDGPHDMNSLVLLAKEIGFYSATVTTNAQLSFRGCIADSIWVSIDGVGLYHDLVRGEGAFKTAIENIEESGHPKLSINMVVNKLNYPSVKETIEFAKNHPSIKSIALNFHTPYQGTEELMLDWDKRSEIIDEIIAMKKQGYPIMNSVSGLKLMKHNNFKKRCWVTNFIMVDGTKLSECQGKTAGVCDRCGFCMAGEMNSVFAFKPDTITAGMKLRMKG